MDLKTILLERIPVVLDYLEIAGASTLSRPLSLLPLLVYLLDGDGGSPLPDLRQEIVPALVAAVSSSFAAYAANESSMELRDTVRRMIYVSYRSVICGAIISVTANSVTATRIFNVAAGLSDVRCLGCSVGLSESVTVDGLQRRFRDMISSGVDRVMEALASARGRWREEWVGSSSAGAALAMVHVLLLVDESCGVAAARGGGPEIHSLLLPASWLVGESVVSRNGSGELPLGRVEFRPLSDRSLERLLRLLTLSLPTISLLLPESRRIVGSSRVCSRVSGVE